MKVEIDKLRPARREMINPQIEVLGSGEVDSTEVGRIVPIYEAIGAFGSRMMRRIDLHRAGESGQQHCGPAAAGIAPALHYPTRREALIHMHFPPPANRWRR